MDHQSWDHQNVLITHSKEQPQPDLTKSHILQRTLTFALREPAFGHLPQRVLNINTQHGTEVSCPTKLTKIFFFLFPLAISNPRGARDTVAKGGRACAAADMLSLPFSSPSAIFTYQLLLHSCSNLKLTGQSLVKIPYLPSHPTMYQILSMILKKFE